MIKTEIALEIIYYFAEKNIKKLSKKEKEALDVMYDFLINIVLEDRL
jgi:hypothetical protein